MYQGLFESNKVPKNELMIAYRILFQLFNFPDIYQSLNNEEFWRRAMSYFKSEAKGAIGTHLKEMAQKLDFSSENILIISKMLDECGLKIAPSYYSKICGTTGFIAFFLKDALEYMGITEEKKALPQRLYKNAMSKFDVYQKRSEKLKSILDRSSQN